MDLKKVKEIVEDIKLWGGDAYKLATIVYNETLEANKLKLIEAGMIEASEIL